MRLLIVLAAVAACGVAVAYAESIHFGFRYDDYGVVRPWTGREMLQVLTDSWDPTGIEPQFYRPLAAWWYATRFFLFGINTQMQHLISLAGMTLCAVLTGLFVWRDTRRWFAAIAATLIYSVYPAFVYAQAVWLTNQMHLFASAIVLVALLTWQRACRAGGAAWWWLLVLQLAAFGFKEDTLMLLPVVAALTVWRSAVIGDVRWPSRAVVVAGLAILIGLPYWRYIALGKHLGGYGMPSSQRGWENLSRGLDVFLQRPAKRPWQGVAGWYSVACVVVGASVGLLRGYARGTGVYLLGCGALLALAFNAPFYLVAKAEQYHLVGLGCVVMLAGALHAIEDALRSRPRIGQPIAVAALSGALSFLPVTRDIVADFAPCTPATLYTDNIALGWWVVPSEFKQWLRDKALGCRAGAPFVPLEKSIVSATYALGRETDETGSAVNWTRESAAVLLPDTATRANVTVRSPIASAAEPVVVLLRPVGGSAVRVELTDGNWHTQTVRFRGSMRTWLAGGHRLDIDVSPVFVPDQRFENGDKRVLGVLLRVVEPR